MSRIRILPDQVANQIAAGEVIERPAGVVKELVENSLDAGARKITVEFRNGGRSYLSVEDDGCGMSRDEALLSLERHATSKIRQAADLDEVLSFGFRGEALPSIASVSRFTMCTRRKEDEAGTEIQIQSGQILSVRDCGMPVGTRLEIRQLFISVPARRQFLKTDLTEGGHIVQNLRWYALAHPETAFSLQEGGRTIFSVNAGDDLRARVGSIYGWPLVEDLQDIPPVSENDLAMYGLIGRPGLSRTSRQDMLTFVNLRPVQNRTLTYALLESYHSLLPRGRYPVVFLFLRIDPRWVDVNVHPAKREVRFRDESRVRSFVIRYLLGVIRQLNRPAPVAPESVPLPVPAEGFSPSGQAPTSSPERESSSPEERNSGGVSAAVDPPRPPSERTAGQPSPRPVVSSPEKQKGSPPAPVVTPVPAPVRPRPVADGPSVSFTPSWRLLALLQGRYALWESPGGLVMVHLKAARQRIQYEKVLAELVADKPTSQPLLFPVPLELDPISSGVLNEHLPALAKQAFAIEPFGRNFYRVEAIPAWLAPGQAEDFLRDLIHTAKDQGWSHRTGEALAAEMARLACRMVGSGTDERIDGERMTYLMKALMQCDQPLVCPFGRPTYFEISHGELARRFRL